MYVYCTNFHVTQKLQNIDEVQNIKTMKVLNPVTCYTNPTTAISNNLAKKADLMKN